MFVNNRHKKSFKWWENVALSSINMLPYRTIALDKKAKIITLNGNWQFRFLEDVAAIDGLEYDVIFQAKSWDSLPVPAVWELNGYGTPRYINMKYDQGYNPPRIDLTNPVGLYRQKINLIINSAKRYILRMHGIDSAAKIWVNEQFVAYNKNARTTSETEITKYLRTGLNKIEMLVVKYTDLTYIEDQDMFRYGGIFRDIEIVEEGREIHDFFVNGKWLSEDHSELELRVDGLQQKSIPYNYQLLDSNNKLVYSANGMTNTKITVKLGKVIPWNAEVPTLYTLKIKTHEHAIKWQVGFRHIRIQKNIFYFNNVPIKLKGVNMHDFNPVHGRAMPNVDLKENLLKMKDHNINAIRTSHYPKHPLFYKLCDELGFYVIDEADLEAHGALFSANWNDFAENPDYKKHFVDKGLQMAIRDKNHTSVIMFSLGNESGFGDNFIIMSQAIRDIGSAAKIHYEGDFGVVTADVHSNMYTYLEQPRAIDGKTEIYKTFGNFLACKRKPGEDLKRWKEVPHVECEMLHAMGNGPGAIKEYWDFFYQHDQMLGGFIWEWFDHGLKKGDDYLYGGQFGETKHDGNFCIDGLLFPSGEPSPGLIEYKNVIAPVEIKINSKEITIVNKYDFVQPTTVGKLVLTFLNFDKTIIDSREIKLPEIKRLNCHQIILNAPTSEYVCQVKFIVQGKVVSQASDIKIKPVSKTVASAIKVTRKDGLLLVSSGSNLYSFSLQDGSLHRVETNNEFLFRGGQFSTWRPLTDNDIVADKVIKIHKLSWKEDYFTHTMNTRVTAFRINEEAKMIAFDSCETSAGQAWGWQTTTTYTFTTDGYNCAKTSRLHRYMKISETKWLLEFEDLSSQTKYDQMLIPLTIPRMGWDFEIAQDFQKVSYLGMGPHENYSDSQQAALYDKYHTSIKKLWTNYIMPQENGNHSVFEVSLSNGSKTIQFSSDKPFGFNAWNYSTRTIEKARTKSELQEDDHVTFKLNFAQLGLGSAACGAPALKKYNLCPCDYKFEYNLTIK